MQIKPVPTPAKPPRALSARLRRTAPYAAMLLLVLGTLFGSYRASEQSGYQQLDDAALLEIDLYAHTLESELGRYAFLPDLLELNPHVQALIANPQSNALKDKARQELARWSVLAGAMEMWVLGPGGDLLASSHAVSSTALHRRPDTTGSMSSAKTPGAQRFFWADPQSDVPSYLFTQQIERKGVVLGRIGLRVSLNPLEATWADLSVRSESEEILVVDDNGVVIMSSVPTWRYRTLEALSSAELHRLKASGRYPLQTLEPLGLRMEKTIERGLRLVRLPSTDSPSSAALRAAQERPLATLGWRMVILTNPAPMRRNAAYVALGSSALVAFFCLLGIYLLQRRRTLAQLFAARNALQQVNDGLATTVAERTRALESTNAQLLQEMQERQLAQQELLQAGKLAVLGQMSVGIAHEISQPLTALRALSNNTTVLLQQGRIAEATQNLTALGELVARMGRITTQLKSFARRTPRQDGQTSLPAKRSVCLHDAIGNVCVLLEHRIKTQGVEVVIDVSPAVQVCCEQDRLEQVLINLASNALDAMNRSSDPLLCFSTRSEDERVWVRVSDTGPPVSDEVLQHLFEPFFSTKAAGEGLGLGLVISSSIVREWGGTLTVSRSESATGLTFEFDLPNRIKTGTQDV